jgi:DNA recombination protein RmuC
MDIGKSIKTLSKNYDSALSRLNSGRGNIIKRIEHIKTLGIKHKKNLDVKEIFEMQDNIRTLINEHEYSEKHVIKENAREGMLEE